MRSLTLSLPEELVEYLEQCAKREQFDTAADFVSALVQDSYSNVRAPIPINEFRKMIAEGDESGPAHDVDEHYISMFRDRMMKAIDKAERAAVTAKAVR